MSDKKIKGIDVSRWQSKIDWAKVKGDNVEFALIKACQESGFVDSYFKANIEGAQKNKISVGVYHYSKAMTLQGIQAEARYFLDAVRGYTLDYPMVLDLEDNAQKSLGKKALTDMIIAYKKVIEGAGQRFMLYVNTDWRTNYIDIERLGNVLLWQAHYPIANESDMNKIYSVRPSAIDNKVHIWQCTSWGKVAGISGNVDMNWGFVDLSAPHTPKIGDPLGDVLYSDITAYISRTPLEARHAIPTSVADNKTLVAVEDLANYGFDVVWNDKDRTLRVEQNKNKSFKPLAVEKSSKLSGTFKCKYVYTDIKTYLSGEAVKSYAINGRTLMDFELLKKYGTVKWDGKTRELWVEMNL